MAELIIQWQKEGAKINRWVKGQEPTLQSIAKWEFLLRRAQLIPVRQA